MRKLSFLSILALAAFLTGCQSENAPVASSQPMQPSQTSQTPAAVAPSPAAVSAPASDADELKPPVRIAAGSSAPFTDAAGNQWLADQGFEGGDVSARDADLQITNTDNPGLYRNEHYSMDSFSAKIPNGKYIVKLHFAETWEGITGPGQRVFSFNVNGQDFKDFDVWVKAGGRQTAYVETVNVDVTDGTLKITFTSSGMDNPEINGIEILPAS
ncbi:MAG TPA: malectin [Dongiaceae bacterium]|nr:malectin [Dongiaceae bacterium]